MRELPDPAQQGWIAWIGIKEALYNFDVAGVGGILACLVVFAFMRNWRSTVIAAVAIPASVISTFGMMAALDFTLNSVTMLALVLMVGIVIDDAIVVLENIFRFVEEKKLSPFAAAREATAEIALPVLATTLCLVVIFIPVSFMSSISGRFLYQFGFTAAVAILVSLLVSFTLTPMMSARLLLRASTGGGHASRGGFYARMDPKDPQTVIIESQGGRANRVNMVTLEHQAIAPVGSEKPARRGGEVVNIVVLLADDRQFGLIVDDIQAGCGRTGTCRSASIADLVTRGSTTTTVLPARSASTRGASSGWLSAMFAPHNTTTSANSKSS